MKTLETDRLILKTINRSDAGILSNYYLKNIDFLKPRIPLSDISFFTSDNMAERISKENKLFEEGHQINFYIFLKQDLNKIIGNVTISQITRGCFQNGFLGYQLDKEENGKGFAAESVRYAINYSFSEMNLHRIEANVMTDNIASIKLLERLSFQREGFSRNYLKINGKWEDHYRYAIVNKSYLD